MKIVILLIVKVYFNEQNKQNNYNDFVHQLKLQISTTSVTVNQCDRRMSIKNYKSNLKYTIVI